ncbi:MAG TPA: prenyltransferase/squalene oxidase repeat-containing protein [Planctomycetota bacterium]
MDSQASREAAESAVMGNSVPTEEKEPFLYSVTGQTPWWIVSFLLHGLIITLAGLMTVAIDIDDADDLVLIWSDDCHRAKIVEEPKAQVPAAEKVLAEKVSEPSNGNEEKGEALMVDPTFLATAIQAEIWATKTNEPYEDLGLRGDERALVVWSGATGNSNGGGTDGNELADSPIIGAGGAPTAGSNGGWGGGRDGGFPDIGHGFKKRGAPADMIGKHLKNPTQVRRIMDDTWKSLRWLSYHQEPDGHWDAKKYGAEPKTDTAVTGFALLAFLGAGHSEKIGEFRDTVKRSVAWLKSKQAADGCIWDTSDDSAGHRRIGYPSAIATLAICEAAGMANIPDTKIAAQKAIDYCVNTHQSGEGSSKGGWRYAPKSPGDLSVTGWYIMALKSAKVAGLKVPTMAFDGAIRFLDSVEVKEGADYSAPTHYKYMPNAEHAESSHRLTAIGTLARQFMGWKREDLQGSVDSFVNKGGVPAYGANGEKVDLYYWYYATMAVFQQGGDVWKRWNTAMLATLLENQCKQGDETGSWNPVGAYATEWGRVGQTALSTLCLECYYRITDFSLAH